MEITGIGEAQRRRRIKTYLWDIGEYEEAGGDEAEDEENIIPVLDEGIEDALSYIWPGDWGLPGIAFCGWKLIKMNKPRRIDYAVVNKQQHLPVLFARIHAKKKVILLLHLSLVYQD